MLPERRKPIVNVHAPPFPIMSLVLWCVAVALVLAGIVLLSSCIIIHLSFHYTVYRSMILTFVEDVSTITRVSPKLLGAAPDFP